MKPNAVWRIPHVHCHIKYKIFFIHFPSVADLLNERALLNLGAKKAGAQICSTLPALHGLD